MSARLDIPSPGAPNFEQRVREALMTYLGRQGNPLDRGLTLRDLVEAGLLEVPAGYTFRAGAPLPFQPGPALSGDGSGGSPPLDTTPPPAPEGFTVSPAVSHVLASCAAPVYTAGGGHLRSRLYGVTYSGGAEPTFSDAVELAQFGGVLYAHPSNPATTWRLWLRWESRAGVLGPPAGGTTGLSVTTAQDVSTLLTALTGQIAAGQLASALLTRVDLIDGPASTAGTVNARIQTEVTARVAAVAGLQSQIDALVDLESGDLSALIAQVNAVNAALLAETDARTLADSVLSAATQSVGGGLQQGAAALQAEQTLRASENSAFASTVSALAATASQNAAAIRVEQVASTDQNAALASQVTTLSVASGGSAAALQVEQQTRATEDAANAAQTTALAAGVGSSVAGIRAEQIVQATALSTAVIQTESLGAAVGANAGALRVEQQVRASEDGVLAAQTTVAVVQTAQTGAALFQEQALRADADGATVAVAVGAAVATTNTSAGLLTEQLARAGADAAVASRLDSTAAAAGVNAAAIQAEQAARVTEDSALASSVSTISAQVGTVQASVSAETSARITADGAIEAKNTVKIDAAGHLTGYGLIATGNTAAPTSQFGVRADQFFIAPAATVSATAPTTNLYVGRVWVDTSVTPNVTRYRTEAGTWSTTPQRLPFIVQATPTTINGVSVPEGVYIDTAFIRNGTITEALIGNATITNAKIVDATIQAAKIGSVNANTITTGTLNAERIAANSIDATKINTNGLSIRDPSGATIILNAGNGTFAGSLSAATGTFAGSLSAATGTFAGSLSAATGTFAGSLSAATGTFAGSVVVGSGVTYSAGTGVWMGLDGGTPKFRVGSTTQYVRWTGSDLEIKFAGPVSDPQNFFASSMAISPTDAIAFVEFRRNGSVFVGEGTNQAQIVPYSVGNWHDPNQTDAGDLYQIRFDLISGVTPNGGTQLGTWMALSTARSYYLVNTTNGFSFQTSTASYTIRRTSNGQTVCTGQVQVQANIET